jgi:hypothetical protein
MFFFGRIVSGNYTKESISLPGKGKGALPRRYFPLGIIQCWGEGHVNRHGEMDWETDAVTRQG